VGDRLLSGGIHEAAVNLKVSDLEIGLGRLQQRRSKAEQGRAKQDSFQHLILL
jgi:hypothetical protein